MVIKQPGRRPFCQPRLSTALSLFPSPSSLEADKDFFATQSHNRPFCAFQSGCCTDTGAEKRGRMGRVLNRITTTIFAASKTLPKNQQAPKTFLSYLPSQMRNPGHAKKTKKLR